MRLDLSRHLAFALVLAAMSWPAQAQQQQIQQQQPAKSRACTQLEAQLAAFDRSANDPARMEQVQRLEEAANRQQDELNRNIANAKRIGCEGGFFLFGGRPAQCGPLNARIQTQRMNIDRLHSQLAQLQSTDRPEQEAQRRAILVALSQNDCGPQYRSQVANTPPPRGGLFETLFGPGTIFTPGPAGPGGETPLSGSYRTVCVRTCDGYYYPISYSATPERFAADAQTCARSCPAAEVMLYAHRNPGEDMNQAFSTTTNQPYTALPNAFKYRTSFDPLCSCRQPGESWANALRNVEDPVERGDVVVSEERAKQLSQPRFDAQGKPIRPDARTTRPNAPGAPAAPASARPHDEPSKPDPNRKVRAVGPTFIPAR